MKRLLRIFLILLAIGGLALAALTIIYNHVGSYSHTYASAEQLPDGPPRVGIVFGALVRDGGVLSNTPHDRVLVSVEAYKAGRISKLLMSGDRKGPEYDEPAAMKALAVSLGVPENDIYVDGMGKRTYDSCWRAKNIYLIDRAILFTQDYHQPRAIYLCSNLGIDSTGVDTKRRDYDREDYYWFREFLSRTAAWIDINLGSPPPVTEQTQPISQ